MPLPVHVAVMVLSLIEWSWKICPAGHDIATTVSTAVAVVLVTCEKTIGIHETAAKPLTAINSGTKIVKTIESQTHKINEVDAMLCNISQIKV